MNNIDTYRVQYRGGKPKHWWSRTWQAEWDGTAWCPRSYTEHGVLRKARRWQQHDGPCFPTISQRRWWRRVVRRSELYRHDRVRWNTEPPRLDIRIDGHRLEVAGLENIVANALSSDARSRGKRSPLFSVRYGVARRVTLQLAALHKETP